MTLCESGRDLRWALIRKAFLPRNRQETSGRPGGSPLPSRFVFCYSLTASSLRCMARVVTCDGLWLEQSLFRAIDRKRAGDPPGRPYQSLLFMLFAVSRVMTLCESGRDLRWALIRKAFLPRNRQETSGRPTGSPLPSRYVLCYSLSAGS